MSSQPHEDVRRAPKDLGLATDLLSFVAGCRRLVDTGDVQPEEFNSRSIALGGMGFGRVGNYGCKPFGSEMERVDSRNAPGRPLYSDRIYPGHFVFMELPSTPCV